MFEYFIVQGGRYWDSEAAVLQKARCEYAEHAGAARDLFKLSKLGRVGENGSEEVAKGYAKRCADEAKAASALLDVLAMAVQ